MLPALWCLKFIIKKIVENEASGQRPRGPFVATLYLI